MDCTVHRVAKSWTQLSDFHLLGFPDSSVGKESTCNVGDLGLIPGLGRSPGDRNSYPHQYSGLENSMGCVVHGISKSWTRLSDFHSTQQSQTVPSYNFILKWQNYKVGRHDSGYQRSLMEAERREALVTGATLEILVGM